MRVRNMTSARTGRAIPNQFEIYDDGGNVFFQSYQTVIAKIDRAGTVTLNTTWDHSNTTSKYRNQFLGESKRETERKIKSGEHKLADLNAKE
jgi:hypothetical protein